MKSWSICHFCKGAFESDEQMKLLFVEAQGARVQTKTCLQCNTLYTFQDKPIDFKRKKKR